MNDIRRTILWVIFGFSMVFGIATVAQRDVMHLVRPKGQRAAVVVELRLRRPDLAGSQPEALEGRHLQGLE